MYRYIYIYTNIHTDIFFPNHVFGQPPRVAQSDHVAQTELSAWWVLDRTLKPPAKPKARYDPDRDTIVLMRPDAYLQESELLRPIKQTRRPRPLLNGEPGLTLPCEPSDTTMYAQQPEILHLHFMLGVRAPSAWHAPLQVCPWLDSADPDLAASSTKAITIQVMTNGHTKKYNTILTWESKLL